MSDRIVQLTANPILAAIGVLCFGMGHWVVNRQLRKTVVMNVMVVAGTLACVFPGLVILSFSVYEAYMTASRLTTGQTIGKNSYSTWFCYRFACLIDSSATYERSPIPIATS